jgi:hypothetical protein
MASIKNAEKVAASLLEQHQAIHPPIDVQEHLVHFRADASTKQTDPKEIEANFFAAALLLQQALTLRLLNLGLLGGMQAGSALP